jgi:hypothetical protein
MTDDRRTAVERLLSKDVEEHAGRPLSERARRSQRSMEAYLKAGIRPRWMERLMEIERGTAAARRDLRAAHAALLTECAGDRDAFAARWRAHAATRDYSELNRLIRQHNEWFPIERDLPMDPRTGEYLPILGRSHVRPELTEAWILEQFPPNV